ncbi:hypothetical protein N8H71_06275 [Pseudomonas koreensis]|uniref:hypothetical protein n=1 Tax=Pseudomonas koreensis TaxID=198620 RepID=UPI0021C5A811|nr:hypothetical protein [Pseudomonas koreensis]MCU0071185.1 hypothetical protein [Pseudomonas koreensis]
MNAQSFAPGPLDPAFGQNGWTDVPNSLGATAIGVSSIAQDTNGNTYYGCTALLTSTWEFGCFCLTPNGSLVTKFGNGGFASGQFSSIGGRDHSRVESILLQPVQGVLHILLAGEYKVPDVSAPKLAVARLDSNGDLDLRFGNKGTIVHDLPASPAGRGSVRPPSARKSSSESAGVQAIVLPDEKVLLVYRSGNVSYVVRLEPDGALDTKFNGVGYIEVQETGGELALTSVMQTTDGRYLCAGEVWDSAGVGHALFVKFDQAGKPDNSFAVSGRLVVSDPNGRNFAVSHLAQQGNNRIFATGGSFDGTSLRALMLSLESDGKFNIQFNSGKPQEYQVNFGNTDAHAGYMQPDGKLLVAGSVDSSSGNELNAVFLRFLPNGSLDKSLGGDGVLQYTDSSHGSFATFFMPGKVLFHNYSSYATNRINKIWSGLIA